MSLQKTVVSVSTFLLREIYRSKARRVCPLTPCSVLCSSFKPVLRQFSDKLGLIRDAARSDSCLLYKIQSQRSEFYCCLWAFLENLFTITSSRYESVRYYQKPCWGLQSKSDSMIGTRSVCAMGINSLQKKFGENFW